MCTGLFGLIFGHAFEARYTTARVECHVHYPPPAAIDIERLIDAAGTYDGETEVLEIYEEMLKNGNNTQESQYVCDVCTRCGMIVRP